MDKNERNEYLKLLGENIVKIKGCSAYYHDNIGHFENCYNEYYGIICKLIDLLNKEYTTNLKHLNFYNLSDDFYENNMNQKSVTAYLNNAYNPLEDEIRSIISENQESAESNSKNFNKASKNELKNSVYINNNQPIDNQVSEDKLQNNNIMNNKIIEDDLCFVLMPFDEKFNGVYDLIKEDLDNFKLNIKRADDIYGPGIVIKSIFDNIQKSKFLIADLTGCNANVFYELGYAAALDKKVILITQDEFNNMPFDVLGWRTIQYSDSIKGFKHLKKELNSYIENL